MYDPTDTAGDAEAVQPRGGPDDSHVSASGAADAADGEVAPDSSLIDEIRAINARLVSAAIREAELAEQAQAASRAKSEFLALISHELRTPLTAVIGYSDLLQTDASGLNEKGAVWAERIRFSAWHLLEIIDDLISTVIEERGGEVLRPASTRTDAVLREAVALVEPGALEKGLELRIRQPVPDVTLFTDPRKLRQVLTNLLFNAVKFTDSGFVEINAEQVGDMIHFRVCDTGIGIAEADRERIFEPFVQVESTSTRSVGGCGLGLGLSRRYAYALGGDLTMTSSPGNGSTFTFSIPLRIDPALVPPAASSLIRSGSARHA